MVNLVNVLLISTYELGRQPFGVASPAAWLSRAGAEVRCLDLSRQALDERAAREARLIAFFVPMHTATRLAIETLDKVQRLNSSVHICFYGLYAPVNADYLRSLGVHTILGGEFEEGLVSVFQRVKNSDATFTGQSEPTISLGRQEFLVPERSGLPQLSSYAHLNLSDGSQRIVGTTEASRGCKHLCRHCPVVPVYDGRFRVIQKAVVLEDIRRQVRAGAEHITFADPDFFNGPRHALEIVRALHEEFPALTYDVTIKVEHLLEHAQHIPALRSTGCLIVTTAAESFDDRTLERLDKGHTAEDFAAVVQLFREVGLVLSPTFVAFTPWTTLRGYEEFFARLDELDLSESVAPIQLAIRLLIPAGSRLLELLEIRDCVADFDRAALVYPWTNPDPSVDALCSEVQGIVRCGEKEKLSRKTIFSEVWARAREAAGLPSLTQRENEPLISRAAVPYLNEPWYC